MNQFMLGATMMAAAVAGLFFLRFWRQTGDRLFLIFVIAFWLMGVNWLFLSFTSQPEVRTALYVLRLLAFTLIILGIIDKNRTSRRPKHQPAPTPVAVTAASADEDP